MNKELNKDNWHCNKCNYNWKPRKEKPVSCPRCKAYFKDEK